jgi:type VI secretion system secreted protein Hcp
MAVDMFLKLDAIAGESIDKTHKGEIQILAFSFGATQSGSTHMGGGGGSGKVNFQDISFTKYIDKSTPILLQMVANGKHFKEGTLTVRKAGEHPLEYLKIKLNEILVSSYSSGGSGGEDRLTENVTLNFAKIDVSYSPQKADGTGDVAIVMNYDIPANA